MLKWFLRVATTMFVVLFAGAFLFLVSIWQTTNGILEATQFSAEYATIVSDTPLNQAEIVIARVAFNEQGPESYLSTQLCFETKREQATRLLLVRAMLASRLRRQYDRTPITRLALQRLYFGFDYYGLDMISDRLFGKPSNELETAEITAIAALIPNPRIHKQPEAWVKRQRHVAERFLSPPLPQPLSPPK